MTRHQDNVSRIQEITTSYNFQPKSDVKNFANSQQPYQYQQSSVEKPLAEKNAGVGLENLPKHTTTKKLKSQMKMSSPEVRERVNFGQEYAVIMDLTSILFYSI